MKTLASFRCCDWYKVKVVFYKFKVIYNTNKINPPTPAYQGERAQRRLAKTSNIEQTHAVPVEGNWKCELSPKAAKSSFFIGSGRNV